MGNFALPPRFRSPLEVESKNKTPALTQAEFSFKSLNQPRSHSSMGDISSSPFQLPPLRLPGQTHQTCSPSLDLLANPSTNIPAGSYRLNNGRFSLLALLTTGTTNLQHTKGKKSDQGGITCCSSSTPSRSHRTSLES